MDAPINSIAVFASIQISAPVNSLAAADFVIFATAPEINSILPTLVRASAASAACSARCTIGVTIGTSSSRCSPRLRTRSRASSSGGNSADLFQSSSHIGIFGRCSHGFICPFGSGCSTATPCRFCRRSRGLLCASDSGCISAAPCRQLHELVHRNMASSLSVLLRPELRKPRILASVHTVPHVPAPLLWRSHNRFRCRHHHSRYWWWPHLRLRLFSSEHPRNSSALSDEFVVPLLVRGLPLNSRASPQSTF